MNDDEQLGDVGPEILIHYADEDDPEVADQVVEWLLGLLDDPTLDVP